MDDLVQRLRAKYTVTDEFSTIRRPVNPDGHEAADRIEALSAENERLRGALENIGNLSLNGRIKVNTLHGEWVGTPDAYAREVLGMPWRTEDPDDSIEAMENWSD